MLLDAFDLTMEKAFPEKDLRLSVTGLTEIGSATTLVARPAFMRTARRGAMPRPKKLSEITTTFAPASPKRM